MKREDKWDPNDRHIAGIYIYARRRPDTTLRDILEKEGVSISSGCLSYASLLFADETDKIFEILRTKTKFDPRYKYLIRTLVWTVQNNDKRLEEKLKNEGILFNMVCLVSAVDPVFYLSTFEHVVRSIKIINKLDPNSDEALDALNIAVKRQDKSIHQRLLDEGLQWKTRNLSVAVRRTTVWGLRQVIKCMKSVKLLETADDEIKNCRSAR